MLWKNTILYYIKFIQHKVNLVIHFAYKLSLFYLCSGKIAAEFPLFKRVCHLCPFTDCVVSVGQAHINSDQRSIL